MKEKNEKWVTIKDGFEHVQYCVPAHTWKTFKFLVTYYPATKVLQLSEDKYFDDHAVIQLYAENLTVAEHLLEHIINVMTV